MSDNMKRKKERGQIFLEFMLLFLLLTVISFAILNIGNTLIASRWLGLVRIIAPPTETAIQLR